MKITAGTEGTDIVDLLCADDAKVGVLFDRLAEAGRNAADAAASDRMLRGICRMLEIRCRAEEEVLNPAILNENPKLAFALSLASQGISMRVADTGVGTRSGGTSGLAVFRLVCTVRRDLLERRQVLIPFIGERLSKARRQWLGAALARRKAQIRGFVASRRVIADAVEAARRVPGVTVVRNHMRLA